MAHSPDENLKSLFTETPDCPDTHELASVLEEGDRAAQWKHVQGCAHCLGELELLRSFVIDKVSSEEQPHVEAIVATLRKNSPQKPAPWWKWLLKPWTLTPAVVAIAVAIIVIVSLGRRPGDVVLNPVDQVVRSQSIRAVAPIGELAAAPKDIVWSAAPGAKSYKIQIFEADRTVLWTGSSTSTETQLTAEVLRQIVPGKRLLWSVAALDGSGNVIAQSNFTEFRLQR